MQIETTLRFHFIQVKMAKFFFNVGILLGKKLFTAGMSANWYRHCGRQCGSSSKN